MHHALFPVIDAEKILDPSVKANMIYIVAAIRIAILEIEVLIEFVVGIDQDTREFLADFWIKCNDVVFSVQFLIELFGSSPLIVGR